MSIQDETRSLSAGDVLQAPHERFLGALTPELRRQVLALPRVLDAHRDYFVVFSARKALCVADALYRLRYWVPLASSDFCSTRALDGALAPFRDRDVLIVDDIAASGRTIKTASDA